MYYYFGDAVQYIFAALAGSWALALALDFGAQVVGLSTATAWVTAGAVVALTPLLLPVPED